MTKITAENITPKQLRGMRVATIVLAITNLILLTLYLRADLKLERIGDKLLIEKYDSRSQIEQLQTQVDSLTAEIQELEK